MYAVECDVGVYGTPVFEDRREAEQLAAAIAAEPGAAPVSVRYVNGPEVLRIAARAIERARARRSDRSQ